MCFDFIYSELVLTLPSRQTSDSLHAAGQAVLPVQDMEICGVHSVWVLHPDHDRHQHSGPHDEGKKWILYVITVNHLLKSLFLKVHQGYRQTLSHSITQTEVQQCWLLHINVREYSAMNTSFLILDSWKLVLQIFWILSECRVSHYLSCFFFFCSSMMLLIHMRTCWSGWTSSSRSLHAGVHSQGHCLRPSGENGETLILLKLFHYNQCLILN